MRLPLPTNLESRDGDLTQDAKIKNGYIDTEENAPNVVKRAGLELVTTTGDGSIPNDIFVFEDVAYVWRESSPAGSPTLSQIVFPSLGFRNYGADIFVEAPLSDGGSYADITEISGDGVIACRCAITLTKTGMLELAFIGIFLETPDGGVVYGSDTTSITFADFNAAVEVKLEAGNYNVYVNSVLSLALADSFSSFTTPSLDSDTSGTASVNNLQFLP
jgi:hypothetical protein